MDRSQGGESAHSRWGLLVAAVVVAMLAPAVYADENLLARSQWFAEVHSADPTAEVALIPFGARAAALTELRANLAQGRLGAGPPERAGYSWVPLGPSPLAGEMAEEFTGRVTAVAVDPTNPIRVPGTCLHTCQVDGHQTRSLNSLARGAIVQSGAWHIYLAHLFMRHPIQPSQ